MAWGDALRQPCAWQRLRREAVAREHLMVEVAHVRDVPGDTAGGLDFRLHGVGVDDSCERGDDFDGVRGPPAFFSLP